MERKQKLIEIGLILFDPSKTFDKGLIHKMLPEISTVIVKNLIVNKIILCENQ